MKTICCPFCKRFIKVTEPIIDFQYSEFYETYKGYYYCPYTDCEKKLQVKLELVAYKCITARGQ